MRWRSAFAAWATCANSGTCRAPNTWRDAIHARLDALAPQPTADLDQTRKVLKDFTLFWTTETDPNAKR